MSQVRTKANDGENDVRHREVELAAPKIVDRSSFQTELDASEVREKAHTREGWP
jgi:hypothetical protein